MKAGKRERMLSVEREKDARREVEWAGSQQKEMQNYLGK